MKKELPEDLGACILVAMMRIGGCLASIAMMVIAAVLWRD